MIEARHAQRSFGDGFITAEINDLREPWMAHVEPGTKASVTPSGIVVDGGDPVDMQLPTGPLPAPKGLPSMEAMLNTAPSAERHAAFEICGDVMGTAMESPATRLPSCGWYFAKYDAQFWGGTPFRTLEMMRDADDTGTPSNDPNMPRVNFVKDGLFNPDKPLFGDMIAGNYEEWTVFNRSFSDHPFHIHQNHFLLTKINGKPLATPEWHDTVRECPEIGGMGAGAE